ncbi:MAG: Translation elongation factor P [Candidatus Kapaibacterium sp.]|jgi:elongation factor P|nr:MAG: Translation elongation factor P [Candidatus Kapabacteria bacterium]
MPMGTTSDLRPGAVINFNGELHIVLESEHRTPGNLRAFYQVKMRNMKTGRLSEYRFRSGESIEFVYVERKDFQYLYNDGHNYFFMDMENFEQIPLDSELVGNAVNYLTENMEVQIAFVDGQPIGVELPTHVNLRVVQTEPGVRGDTATNVLKPAVLESGVTIQVPIFINEGDLIRVDTRTGEYVERVKET